MISPLMRCRSHSRKTKMQSPRHVWHISYGVMDVAPADPVEGILIAQLMAANEAALAMYQKGWAQPPEYFQARTKYPAAGRQGQHER